MGLGDSVSFHSMYGKLSHGVNSNTAYRMTASIDKPEDIKVSDHIMANSTVGSEVTLPPILESQEQPRHKKLVNVTVTILSIDGLFIEDVGAGTQKRTESMPGKFSIRNMYTCPSNVGPPPRKIKTDESETETDSSILTASMSRDNSAEPTNSTTRVVASLTRITKNKNVMVHLSSLPLTVPTSNIEGSLAKQKKKERDTLSSVVHWPEYPQEEDALRYKHREPSSYQFQLAFHAEFSTTTSRFIPQSVPIQVSVSRFGRMYKLGTANLLLSGEENGDSSLAVPVTSCYRGTVKNNKFKSIFSSLTKHCEDKEIRMLALKGDTLKCGLDPNATLRVLVHVSEPICETLEISPKLNVTMIPSNVQAKIATPSVPSTQRDDPDSQHKDGTTTENCVPSAISWEYHPNLATIVVNKPDYGMNDATLTNGDNDCTLLRVITHGDDADDDEDENSTVDINEEPSCSSSAYMSAIEENHNSHQCYPSKYDLSTRSSSTATMTTTSVSILSDLTDGRSWQSQTGIEVIPYSTVNPIHEQVRLRSYSRSIEVKDVNEYDSVSEETCTTRMTSFGRASTTSSRLILPSTAKPVVKTWQQRFACGFPVCGTAMYNRSAKAESAGNEYSSISPHWLRLTGKCESLVDHDDDEGSSWSESSSES